MAAFTRVQGRFLGKGVMLNTPADACPPGYYPNLLNVRPYLGDTLQPRLGQTLITNGAIGAGVVHSIFRLNDSTPFAAVAFWRVFGCGTVLRAGNPTYPQIDTTYSGNPLSMVAMTPYAAPNPWLYIADTLKMRKIDVNGGLFPIGIAQPPVAPAILLNPLYRSIIDTFAGVAWVNAGVDASVPVASGTGRVNTTISAIYYDAGVAGLASVVPVSMDGIDQGVLMSFNGGEIEPIQQVTIAVANTTIAQIIYDVGATGLCTIQPTASLGTGQLEMPTMDDYRARAGGYAVPRDQPSGEGLPTFAPRTATARIRQVDFPVNCLVRIKATETVRILSVALGPNGVQSFRCSTAGTFAAGDAIVGIAAFRVDLAGTFAAGNTLTAASLSNTLTPVGTPLAALAGVKTDTGWAPVESVATINAVAVQPDDDVHLAIRISDCTVVDTVRVYLDVNGGVNEFTENYLFFEWRANDIIAAIQASNVAPVQSLQSTRPTVVSNEILNKTRTALLRGFDRSNGSRRDPSRRQPTGTGGATGDQALTSALAIGNNQWIELHCKVRDLVRVGTNPSLTLNDLSGAEILVSMAGPDPINIDYHSLWISGGRGPDVGVAGSPYVACYRYRSSRTGAISNPSPATRSGVVARRQGITYTGALSADTQVDLVDWFRLGGNLTRWTYTGSTPNAGTPSFQDTNADAEIDGGPELEYTRFQPFAVPDLPRSGTCKVAGNAVKWLTGDTFNTSWAPGTPIAINGRIYTLYAQPSSTTLLFLNENAGSAASTNFAILEPTLLSQPLPSLWGDANGILFACGDTRNPGALYWTWPYDPDRHSDTNVLFVTSGSEILQNGFVWDGVPFVFSSNQLYVLQVDPNTGKVAAFITPCGRGLWARWAFCWTPEGIAFVASDGIYLSAGGGQAVSLTDVALYPLFPHDGIPGVAVNGFNPPDMATPARLRLAYVNGWLYFDYTTTGGVSRTMAMRMSDRSWWPDVYGVGVQARYSAQGNGVYEELIGGTNGSVYNPSGILDAAAAIPCTVQFVENMQDTRRQKLLRDLMIDADVNGTTLAAQLGLDDNATLLAPITIGAGAAGRNQYPVGIIPQTGTFCRNLTTTLTFSAIAAGLPILYGWDVAFQPAPELSPSWLSGPTAHGIQGYQHVAGIYFAYRSNGSVVLSLIIDNVVYTYALPTTSNQYVRVFQWLRAVKGLGFQYGAQGVGNAALQVFDADCEVLLQPFGQSGYMAYKPF